MAPLVGNCHLHQQTNRDKVGQFFSPRAAGKREYAAPRVRCGRTQIGSNL